MIDFKINSFISSFDIDSIELKLNLILKYY